MYPPPNRDVIALLLGQVIEAICFGKYVMHLLFESGDKVSVSSPFRFSMKECGGPLYDFPVRETDLPQAIGSTITDVVCDEDGTLRLMLSNGYSLFAYANDPSFEAYTLSLGGKEYVV
jgi:hypothetical protein